MRLPKHIYLNPFFRICHTKSSERHVFVVGAPRSGTTLIANVISNHSKFCSLSAETDIFGWKSCFAIFEGSAGMHSGEFNQFRRQFSNVVELVDGLANKCKKQFSSERFVEKTPQHVFHLSFILKHFPQAQVVNVVRDPRDAFVSSKSNKSVVQNNAIKFTKYWRQSISSRQQFVGHKAIKDIRYECFVRSPEFELKELMSWLGADFEPDQIRSDVMANHPRAGHDAFRLLGKPISTASVGRWKSELNLEEVNSIHLIAGRRLMEWIGGDEQ
jgi:hypothetical protein